jgi:hypothetical protein
VKIKEKERNYLQKPVRSEKGANWYRAEKTRMKGMKEEWGF